MLIYLGGNSSRTRVDNEGNGPTLVLALWKKREIANEGIELALEAQPIGSRDGPASAPVV